MIRSRSRRASDRESTAGTFAAESCRRRFRIQNLSGKICVWAEPDRPIFGALYDAARQEGHHRRTIGITVVIAGDLADELLGLNTSRSCLPQFAQDLVSSSRYFCTRLAQFHH